MGPRDGLQAESVVLDVKTRLELIVLLMEAGVRRIEVASFVNPEVVPQMADAEEIVADLPQDDAVSYIGLVLNQRGLERALSVPVDEVNFVAPATDGYSLNNQRATSDEILAELVEMIPAAQAEQRRVTVTISVAFGCPYEGEVSPGHVASVARQIAEAGADSISLADTIGVAGPSDVTRVVAAVHEVAAGLPLGCHFHNTRNTGYANAVAAVDAGVRFLDAAVGGYGGSPFAPGAGGNIATEDLAYLLGRMGIQHHLDAERLVSITDWLSPRLGTPPKAMLGEAGIFP